MHDFRQPSTVLLALAATAVLASAQEHPPKCGFPDRDLRSGPADASPPSDCGYFSTTPQPGYDPSFTYDIPVVFHVIQNTGGLGYLGPEKVQSQIDVLNEDFQAIPGSPGGPGTNALIRFHLATVDPDGNPTTGITYSTDDLWFTDGGAYWNTLAWDTNRYMNVYTNNGGGYFGYVPDWPQGGIVGLELDRIVVLWSTVGKGAAYGPPFDLGRTLTHETGHYFGIEHPFYQGCGSAAACYTTGDLICDTNQQATPTYGCPFSKSTCGSPDSIHNYMDYSDDPCMSEFTAEQINRMRCTIEHWRPDLPLDGPLLVGPTPGTPGVLNTITLDGALPGGLVGVAYGFAAGSTPIGALCPGLSIAVANPTVLGTATADGTGSASFSGFVPPSLAGTTLLVQGADLTGCEVTNLVQHTF